MTRAENVLSWLDSAVSRKALWFMLHLEIAGKLVEFLKEHGMHVTTAESCTGGMISSAIVDVPGASSVLTEAYVTYSNEAKMRLLGVKAETLEKFGAVSRETVREMAEGAKRVTKADCVIAVSGVAGPDGGSEDKPVGTIYAGFVIGSRSWVRNFRFSGTRREVREQTTRMALEELYINLVSKFIA